MPSFTLKWTPGAEEVYNNLKAQAAAATAKRGGTGKSPEVEGLFKQNCKALANLSANPKHPSLHTHEYDSLNHPWDHKQKVWEAYAQNKTPGAYRIFWCYGPQKGQITIIAITPHP